MDPTRIDSLAKLVGSGQSRRGILRAFLGGGLAVAAVSAGISETDAAGRCRNDGVVCGKNADCCSSSCLPPDHTGRRVCGEVCIPDGGPCSLLAQDSGGCCSGICELNQGDSGFCCSLVQGPLFCGG